MTGREVLSKALLLMDRIDESGDVDLSNTADYERKAVALMNPYISELSKAERRANKVLISSLEDEINLETDTINQCLVYAIAFNLAFMDNDMNVYNLYQSMYEQNKEHIALSEESVEDTFNMIGGMI